MDVINHSATVYEQLEHLPQRRFVVETSDRLWRRSVCDGLRDAEDNRSADATNFGAQILLSGFFHLAKSERTSEKAGQNVNDLPSRRRNHLVHPVGDDIAGAGEDQLSVGTSSDQTRDSTGFMDRDRLIALERVLVATYLGNDGVTQPESLVAMLLHIFDLILSSFGNVDRAHCFEETEGDDGVDSAGHLVGRRRAQANRRSNCLQEGNRDSGGGDFKKGARLTDLCVRALAGALLSLLTGFGAKRKRTLSTRGAVARPPLGTGAGAAGWGGGIPLLSFLPAAPP